MTPAVSQVSRSTRTRLRLLRRLLLLILFLVLVIPNQMLVDGIVHNLSSGDTQA